MKNYLIVISFAILFATSCKKDDDDTEPVKESSIQVKRVTSDMCIISISGESVKPNTVVEISTDKDFKELFTGFKQNYLGSHSLGFSNLKSMYKYYGRLKTSDGKYILFDFTTEKSKFIKETEGKYKGNFNVYNEITIYLLFINQDTIQIIQPVSPNSKVKFSIYAKVEYNFKNGDKLETALYVPKQYISILNSHIKGDNRPLMGNIFKDPRHGFISSEGKLTYSIITDKGSGTRGISNVFLDGVKIKSANK